MSFTNLWVNNSTDSRDDSLPITTSPSPSHYDIVSDEQWYIVQVVNGVVLCGLVSLFGVASNIINIVVFAKQGFQDSMNISLMGEMEIIKSTVTYNYSVVKNS
ncbi:uncharacterized protein LOC118478201 [Aplysia californica]|uniref:Uncharacterized protein LOC118478201 n=1 Tax=Aplysia californica TaxID=6500 RepID=A0ABM1VXR1_APLCA|nr:uncharacterized protein LOC118478201 [Aplysia californica]